MKAFVNGRECELSGELTLVGLLEHLGAPTAGIAVAKNDRVVRRAAFASELVREGDRIEIIRAVAGG
ncbi:MAG: sulfur carrier protein ThiS [Candidatus Eremiobacteraeota bacterium]|nr:sulfur carrier protein ThiS [Candidatus Eremiobacteraeota bacterium]